MADAAGDGRCVVSAAIRMLDSALDNARARLKKFTSDLATYPAHAFEWSDDAFEAAATLFVFSVVKKQIATKPIAELRAHAQREVNAAARRGSRSTSVPANLMRDELMTAWTRALEILQYDDPAPAINARAERK